MDEPEDRVDPPPDEPELAPGDVVDEEELARLKKSMPPRRFDRLRFLRWLYDQPEHGGL